MSSAEGTLQWSPLAQRLDLVAPPVAAAAPLVPGFVPRQRPNAFITSGTRPFGAYSTTTTKTMPSKSRQWSVSVPR